MSLGNKLLDLDLVPREEDGRPADPDQQGIAHIFNVVRTRFQKSICKKTLNITAFPPSPNNLAVVFKFMFI
jgi:hypothetical protein